MNPDAIPCKSTNLPHSTTTTTGETTTNPSATGKSRPLFLTLLLRHTDRATSAARRLGVLTTDAETPVVAETSVGADLLEALQILAQFAVNTVGKDLRVLSIDNVALSVEEP
jgi:hypothetical protein